MKGAVVVAMVVVAAVMLMMVEPGQAAITCPQVNSALAPCIKYLINGGEPPKACCTGVNNLKNMASTTPDRRFACGCVKQAASRYKTIRADAASALPSKCGVQLGIPISRNVDCNKIS